MRKECLGSGGQSDTQERRRASATSAAGRGQRSPVSALADIHNIRRMALLTPRAAFGVCIGCIPATAVAAESAARKLWEDV